jgi:hypothetical protein
MKELREGTNLSIRSRIWFRRACKSRFDGYSYFLIVDSETMWFEAAPNVASDAMSGACIQAAQIIASKGVKAFITENIRSNTFQTGGSGNRRES